MQPIGLLITEVLNNEGKFVVLVGFALSLARIENSKLRMKPWVRKANKDEQQIAMTSLEALAQSAQYIKKRARQNVVLTIPGVEGAVEIPRKSFFLLKEMIGHVAEGRSVTLVHSESEVTTQQAADMLNVSRPHIVKLLESGVIPFKRMKKHRRIALEDIVAYASSRQIDLDSIATDHD